MNKLELIEKACVIRLGQIEIYKALVKELKKEIELIGGNLLYSSDRVLQETI